LSERLNVIVAGLIGQYPIGGVTWDYVQYILGLRALGHKVWYIEDSEQWPYNPDENGCGREARYNAEYLAGVMGRFDLADRWSYRFPGGSLPSGEVFPERLYGLSPERRRQAIAHADVLINVSSGIGDPLRYRDVPRLVYVDTDPVFTQIRAVQDPRFRAHLDAHDAHFTYGECPSQAVPDTGHHWRPMRKPIAIDQWDPSRARRDVFTTVMNWTSYGDVTWNGRGYGQKDQEFLRFLDLPQLAAPHIFELAVGGGITRRAPRDLLVERGWRLVDPLTRCAGVDDYRRYIETSIGEWTVAKNAYVEGRSGWFSGRSACYLAAGNPVVVQDTGFSPPLPTGVGIVAFNTLEQAVAGVREVASHWRHHSRAAREIAEAYFDAGRLTSRLLDDVSSSSPHAAAAAVQRGPTP
jgi:hypothetical protein